MEMAELWLRDRSGDADERRIFTDDNDILWGCSSDDCGSDCDSEVKFSVDER